MNIVHRDVSPQNVLICYEGEVKVIDFGIAKAAGKATKTQAGILKGKFGYMSPEQIRGLPLDRRSRHLRHRRLPLRDAHRRAALRRRLATSRVLEKVRKAEVLPPSTYNRRIPEALEKIVLKALAQGRRRALPVRQRAGATTCSASCITSDAIFSRKDLMQYMKSTFAEEVEREKQRLQEYADIKPPEGMLAAAEMGFGSRRRAPHAAPAAPRGAAHAAPRQRWRRCRRWPRPGSPRRCRSRSRWPPPRPPAPAPAAPRRSGCGRRCSDAAERSTQPAASRPPVGWPAMPQLTAAAPHARRSRRRTSTGARMLADGHAVVRRARRSAHRRRRMRAGRSRDRHAEPPPATPAWDCSRRSGSRRGRRSPPSGAAAPAPAGRAPPSSSGAPRCRAGPSRSATRELRGTGHRRADRRLRPAPQRRRRPTGARQADVAARSRRRGRSRRCSVAAPSRSAGAAARRAPAAPAGGSSQGTGHRRGGRRPLRARAGGGVGGRRCSSPAPRGRRCYVRDPPRSARQGAARRSNGEDARAPTVQLAHAREPR